LLLGQGKKKKGTKKKIFFFIWINL
jgi:hypothetical protein